MKTWFVCAAVIAVALLALACESDDGGTGSPASEATPQQAESQIKALAKEHLIGVAKGLGEKSACEAVEFDGASGEWKAECVCPICFESQDIVVVMRVPDAPGSRARVESCEPLESGACKISPERRPGAAATGETTPEEGEGSATPEGSAPEEATPEA
ncbi:MAG: hypothetical protein WD379_08725 [Dehalococcoidia bacterium]